MAQDRVLAFPRVVTAGKNKAGLKIETVNIYAK